MIDANGEVHKSIALTEALRLAQESDLDLVEVNPTGQPPVCKIMDFGQYQYQLSRKQQEAKQKSKKVEVKGIRLSFKIGKGDLLTRQKQTAKFLEKGHKVKIEMILRGRERQHTDLAKQIISDFITTLPAEVKVEQPVNKKGHVLTAQIARK